jgi:cyclopropane-fatty-acyl-phospholipid synthase
MSLDLGLALAERGLVPLAMLRRGIRRLLRQRLTEIRREEDNEAAFRSTLRTSPVAVETASANEQHYEVPATFFEHVLGPHLKYSGSYWAPGVERLADAEEAMLKLVCERAELEDGQEVLELGCGWGSLSLYLARRYRKSRIVAVSNSASQREFIEARAPSNLQVITADMNAFDTDRQFDRVVSIEMFEHMRNYEMLHRRIAGWLRPEGKLFVHVFCHREHAYAFGTEGTDNWMGRHFFTGGVMPSFDLLPSFDRDLRFERTWVVDGRHYQRTAEAWRRNLEIRKAEVLSLFRSVYGSEHRRWYHRWRLFFLACEELFGYHEGREWMIGHYLAAPRALPIPASSQSLDTAKV